uniref:WAT1-related protein n=1 Tax=Oryza meridionalis TaxID=40149 RepID=A0A0E0CUQ8_9ORYZ
MVKASMKPYFVAIIVQLIYTGMFVISKAAFNHGMNTYIFIFYRQAVGSLILLPAALLQRLLPDLGVFLVSPGKAPRGILLAFGDIDLKLEYRPCAVFLLYHDESIEIQ